MSLLVYRGELGYLFHIWVPVFFVINRICYILDQCVNPDMCVEVGMN